MLPEWYGNCEPPCGADMPRVRLGRPRQLVRRALASLGEALAREMNGVGASAPWFSRLDARAKVAGTAALIAAVSLLHAPAALGVAFVGLVALSLSCGLSWRRMMPLWVGVPLFSLIIILPATLNVVTDGRAIFTLWQPGTAARLGPWRLPPIVAVTAPGLVVAGRFVLRATDCALLTWLVIATTERSALVSGLRRLGMPRTFGMVLAMMQRYLAVLLRAAQETHLAKLSRSMGESTARSERRWLAAGMGSLFRRSQRLAEDVHQAMRSRGFTGEVRTRASEPVGPAGWLWVTSAIAFSVGLIVADHLTR